MDATTFSASLIHTPTMQELASVRRFLDGLCSGSNNDSASAAPMLRLIRRVDISPGSVSILLDRNTFAACLSMGPDRIREDALRIHAPFRLRRRGVETKLVLGNPTKSVDRTLVRNIANALSWLDRIKADKTYEEIATEDAFPTDRVLCQNSALLKWNINQQISVCVCDRAKGRGLYNRLDPRVLSSDSS